MIGRVADTTVVAHGAEAFITGATKTTVDDIEATAVGALNICDGCSYAGPLYPRAPSPHKVLITTLWIVFVITNE